MNPNLTNIVSNSPFLQNQPSNQLITPASIIQKIRLSNQNQNQIGTQLKSDTADSPSASMNQSVDGHEWDGLCEGYVERQLFGKTGIFPSAISAYNTYAKQGNIKTSTDAPKNAQVFFAADDSNGGYGHTGISNGDGTFSAATYSGVKTYNLNDWEKTTGQNYLGYVDPNS